MTKVLQKGVLRLLHLPTQANRDLKQITIKGATTATVTKEDWREYVHERSSNSKIQNVL